MSKTSIKAIGNLLNDFCNVSDRKYKVVKLKERIEYTKVIKGSLEDLKNGILYLFEKNSSGHCLCLLNDRHLVIVDRRDILDIVC